jgi:hypothetical protein
MRLRKRERFGKEWRWGEGERNEYQEREEDCERIEIKKGG